MTGDPYMINQNQLKENMRDRFIDVMSDIANHAYADLLEKISSYLQDVLQIPYVAIYSYNKWDQTYELETNDYQKKLTRRPFQNKISIDDNEIVSNSIRLHTKVDPKVLLFLAYERSRDNQFTIEFLDLIKQEVERYINILNYYKKRKAEEEKSAFLFEITTKFYAILTKKNILTEMIRGMNKLYPLFKYNILLSQDYKEKSTLPIRTIEYSDDATKKVSTQAFITGEVQLEDRVNEYRTFLYAPLKGNQGVYGVLQIITTHAIDFPKNEIEFIGGVAKVAGKALETATLLQNSNHLVKDLKLINDATHALNSNLNITGITEIVRAKIMEACGATQVGFIYTGETQHHIVSILSGSTDYFFSSEGEQHADFILNQVIQKKEAIFSGNFTKRLPSFPFSSVMAVPMLHAGTVHGVIVITHEDQYAFSFDKFKLIQSLVQHFTLALTNSILNEKLKVAAKTDHLTKLYLRNYLEEELEKHITADEKGTLLIVDIDDFKGINDTFGHHIGDEVLVQIASIIKAHTAENDIPARWGGEELAIYLSNATLDEGVHIATQIRKQAESFTDPKVTLSCGVATWDSSRKADVKDLFIRADKALYTAKETGKNCVVKELVNDSY